MTQAELGVAAGIDWTTVSGIERGESAPDFATIETIADVLAIGLDQLVGRDRQPDFVIRTPDGVSVVIEMKVRNAPRGVAPWEDAVRKLLGPLFSMTADQAEGLQGISFGFTPPAAGAGETESPGTGDAQRIADLERSVGELDGLVRGALAQLKAPEPRRAKKKPGAQAG